MISLQDLVPQIALIGQIAGQFYNALFNEFVSTLGKKSAEIQAFLLTKVFIETMLVLHLQQDKTLISESIIAQVLPQFQPEGDS